MADIVDVQTRSRIMASVKTRGTSLELRVRRILRNDGYRILMNVKRLPGSPDIVLPDVHAVVFVNGCFWHRHGCGRTTTPRAHRFYWERKFQDNLRRDRRVRRRLRRMGWRAFTVWGCKSERDVARIRGALVGPSRSMELKASRAIHRAKGRTTLRTSASSNQT